MCGGGTGGHVYPALAVAEALFQQGQARSDLLYVGAPGSVEEGLACRHGLAFAGVQSGQLRGKAPWTAARALIRAAGGVRQAQRVIAEFRPQAIFSTGGYAAAPTLIAGRRAGVPALIYLPDIEPGVTIKLLSRLARRVAVSFDEVRRYFPAEKVVATGYPVRRALSGGNRSGARRRLGLPEEGLVVLAFGGSQGARSINKAVAAGAGELTVLGDVVHVTGSLDYAWVCQARDALAEVARARYLVHEYLHEEMVDALLAADLAIARAGASTLGEFPAAGVPSILVPYPYSGQHQVANARFMERHGAAVVIEDSLLAAQLVGQVEHILRSPDVRTKMAEAARALARPAAAAELAQQLQWLAAPAQVG